MHCEYGVGDTAGRRVGNLAEVCGGSAASGLGGMAERGAVGTGARVEGMAVPPIIVQKPQAAEGDCHNPGGTGAVGL